MHRLYPAFLFLTLFLAQLLRGQSVEVFHNAQFGQSPEAIMALLSPHSEAISLVEAKEVRFPLSRNKESHLLIKGLQLKEESLEKVAFTFADNALVYVEAHGGTGPALMAKRNDTAVQRMGYSVYFDDLVFFDPEEDIAWFLTPESVHPNLFTWKNPYLSKGAGFQPPYDTSARVPDFIEMGGSLEEMRTKLREASDLMYEEQLDGSDPNAQIQLNAFGVDYAGFPRKIEARFGDEQLNVVWILTGKGEEDRIRQGLIREYGDAISIMDDWEVFANWTVLLRKDKPEVLLLTPELGQYYKKAYFNK